MSIISKPKHQTWIFPLLGAALGGASQALTGDSQITVKVVAAGVLSGLVRYLQHILPDTGTSGLLMKPTQTETDGSVSELKPYNGEGGN